MATYLAAILYFIRKFSIVCRLWCASNRMTVITIENLRGVTKHKEEYEDNGSGTQMQGNRNSVTEGGQDNLGATIWSIT